MTEERMYTKDRRHAIAVFMLKSAKSVHSFDELGAFRAINRACSCAHMNDYGYSMEVRNFLIRKAIGRYNTCCRDTVTSPYTDNKVIYG